MPLSIRRLNRSESYITVGKFEFFFNKKIHEILNDFHSKKLQANLISVEFSLKWGIMVRVTR